MKNLILKIFDRIFLSIPLTIFFILSLGAICLLSVFPSFKPILFSRWFLGFFCYCVLMMLYCSSRRWPALIQLYCYDKRIFSSIHSKQNENNDSVLLEDKEIFSLQFKNKDRRLAADQIHKTLFQRGYRKTAYRKGQKDEEEFFYEKAKASIFGSHVVHLAIAILLFAGILTAGGGRFYDFSIREGETIQLEGTDALLTLEKFSVIPSPEKKNADEYASRLRINRPNKLIEWRTLKVNGPLRINGIRLYLARFNLDIEKLQLNIFKDDNKQPIKFLYLGLNQRAAIPELNIAIEVKDFIPDFSIDKNNQAFTRSHLLKNPAAYLLLYSPAASSSPAKRAWIFRGLMMPHGKSITQGQRLRFMLDDIKFRYTCGIKYAKNPGEFITYFGLILLVAGSFLSTSRFYRGLIIAIKGDISGDTVCVSGLAMKCKNMFVFEKEIRELVKNFQLRMEN